MLYSDASRREEERKHLQANFWTLGPPRPRPRRDQSISNSLYHPIVSWGWCGFSDTMWGLYEVWPRHMQSQEIEEFDANGPTTCHSSLSLRLSAFLPVFENLLCFLFVVFGAAMRKHLESNNVRMSGVSWKRWIGYVMSSENHKHRKIMLLSGACGVPRWLLQTMQIDGMMVVFLLLLKLLGNSGEGCSLSFTLLVPKDSLGCVYAGAVSIIRQIAGLETGLFSRWQCFTLE